MHVTWTHMRGKKRPAEERFWEKVEKTDGCWLWMGATDHSGYGKFSAGSILVRAHRWSYEQTVGPIPSGASVLHRCDVPSCVRPDHLFIGDAKANACDAAAKGRTRGWWSTPGAVHPNKGKSMRKGVPWSEKRKAAGMPRSLTPEQEAEVRRRWAAGEAQAALGREFGLAQTTISAICKRG